MPKRRTESAEEEVEGADVDGAEHGDEAQKVEPSREPACEAVAEDRAPVIEAAGGRIGRRDLRQRQGEQARRSSTPTGQPMPMAAPPAPAVAWPSELMPPDRIQMIENEMAKFENACMRRESSCAYPHAVQDFLHPAHGYSASSGE